MKPFDTTTQRGLDELEHTLDQEDAADTVRAMQFATDEHGRRLMSVDPAYKRRVEALYELQYGSTRRNANGQPVDERGRRIHTIAGR